jgi:excisionase family DNA binding protein
LADRVEAIGHAMKAPEVARLLDLPIQRVYRLAREHEIPSFRFGTSVLFDPRSVAARLRENQTQRKESTGETLSAQPDRPMKNKSVKTDKN